MHFRDPEFRRCSRFNNRTWYLELQPCGVGESKGTCIINCFIHGSASDLVLVALDYANVPVTRRFNME